MNAQLDNNNNNNGATKKGKSKGILSTNTKITEKPKSLTSNTTNGFKDAYTKQKEAQKKKQQEQELQNKGILTQAQLNNFRVKEMYGSRTIKKVDTYHGAFLTLSKNVTLSFKDFGAIDGDIIAIYHNDIPIVNRVILNQHYQSFTIDLENGRNKVEILALNQGNLGANTAKYKLTDSDGFQISSQYWFLATQAKATFYVTKNR
jgi:hypothetical protein